MFSSVYRSGRDLPPRLLINYPSVTRQLRAWVFVQSAVIHNPATKVVPDLVTHRVPLKLNLFVGKGLFPAIQVRHLDGVDLSRISNQVPSLCGVVVQAGLSNRSQSICPRIVDSLGIVGFRQGSG